MKKKKKKERKRERKKKGKVNFNSLYFGDHRNFQDFLYALTIVVCFFLVPYFPILSPLLSLLLSQRICILRPLYTHGMNFTTT